jgi:hypothetical protein
MSAGDDSWPLIRQLSACLDGDRERSERKLDELQARLKALPPHTRDEIRRQMILIVACLSRLEVRCIDAHGPLQTAV